MNKFVKCSESLPEVGVEVLIRIPVGARFNVENGSSRGEGHCYQVTHWAPMPEVSE